MQKLLQLSDTYEFVYEFMQQFYIASKNEFDCYSRKLFSKSSPLNCTQML